jgi:hypothetical protein
MIAYLVVVGLFSGIRPLETFGYFLPDAALPALAGLGSHLAVSAVYGSIFGLIKAGIGAAIGRRQPSWLPMGLAGIIYGFLLWLPASLIIIPSDISGLGEIPAGHLLAAHLVYGLATGRLLVNERP